MKKRLRKKTIAACFDKLPTELYNGFLHKKCKYNALGNVHSMIRKGKKDGYKSYLSITGPEGTVYKKFKK